MVRLFGHDFTWEKKTTGATTQRGVVAVAYLLILGMVVCSIVLATAVPESSDVSGAGVGLAAFSLFAAAAAAGAGLGFLFGLPRSRYAEAANAAEQANRVASSANTDPRPGSHYLTNSNLIKVSDWLTTIIVGVGLVNLGKVGPAVGQMSDALEEPLGGAPYSGLIGVTTMIVASIGALILCYLWTSIRVRELLEEIERDKSHDDDNGRGAGARNDSNDKPGALTAGEPTEANALPESTGSNGAPADATQPTA